MDTPTDILIKETFSQLFDIDNITLDVSTEELWESFIVDDQNIYTASEKPEVYIKSTITASILLLIAITFRAQSFKLYDMSINISYSFIVLYCFALWVITCILFLNTDKIKITYMINAQLQISKMSKLQKKIELEMYKHNTALEQYNTFKKVIIEQYKHKLLVLSVMYQEFAKRYKVKFFIEQENIIATIIDKLETVINSYPEDGLLEFKADIELNNINARVFKNALITSTGNLMSKFNADVSNIQQETLHTTNENGAINECAKLITSTNKYITPWVNSLTKMENSRALKMKSVNVKSIGKQDTAISNALILLIKSQKYTFFLKTSLPILMSVASILYAISSIMINR